MSLIFKFAWRYSSYFVAAKSIPNHWDKESYFLWSKSWIIELLWVWLWWIVFLACLTKGRCFALFPAGTNCQGSSPLQISDTLQAEFEPAENLSSGLVDWSCAVVMTATPRCNGDPTLFQFSLTTVALIKFTQNSDLNKSV